MKLHLPVSLLMAVLAAAPVSMAKTFVKETGELEWDGTHLNLAEALGGGLTKDMQWAVNIQSTERADNTTYYLTSRPSSSTESVGDNDFIIDINHQENYIEIFGYGWTQTKYNVDNIRDIVFSLVHIPGEQFLNKTVYGDWSNEARTAGLVGFYPQNPGTDNQMFTDTTGDKNSGPGDGWTGLTDLYVYFAASMPKITVTYTYEADKYDNQYTIGGAGTLTSGTDGSQGAGGCGVFNNYGEQGKEGDVFASEQQQGSNVEAIFGEESGAQNTMYFMAEGTDRELNDEDRKDGESSTIKEAGTVTADFDLYLKGLVAKEGTGNYTLQAGSFTFGSDAQFTLEEGGGSAFTIQATAVDGTIKWSGSKTFDLAAGKTLRLLGEGSGTGGTTTLKGGGTLSLLNGSTLGTSGRITISGGSTLDLNSYGLGNSWDITLESSSSDAIKGANLARVGSEMEADVTVKADAGGTFNLGGLDGSYLSGAQFRAAGNITGLKSGTTVTLTGPFFSFFVDAKNLTSVGASGGTYLMQFLGTGTLKVNSSVGLTFSNEAVKKMSDGYVDLWFSNGSFDIPEETLNDPAELLRWFHDNFDLEAGTEVHDIIEGEPGKNGGRLRLLISTDGIWIASKHGNPIYADYINNTTKWKQVRVDADMTIEFRDSDKNTNITLLNVSSGDGQGSLTVKNSSAKELTLTINQQASGSEFDILNGDLILDEDINLTKEGDRDLHITGNLQGAKELTVEAGTPSTTNQPKLIIDGQDSYVDALKDVSGELELNGVLTLKKQETDTKSDLEGSGSISGKGVLRMEGGELDMNNVLLDGVGLCLDKNEEGSYASLTTSDNDNNKISGISGGDGAGVGGTLTLGGNLTIDHTGSNTGSSDFSGAIVGEGTITVQSEGTKQMLRSKGSENVDLTVKGGAFLSLAGGDDKMKEDGKNQEIKYGTVTVGEGDAESGKKSALTVQAQNYGTDYAAVTQLQVEELDVKNGAQLNVLYNMGQAGNTLKNGDVAHAVQAESMSWDPNATLGLGTLGVNLFNVQNPQDIVDFVIAKGNDGTIDGLKDGDSLKFELGGSFLVYWRDVTVTYKDGQIILNAKASHENRFLEPTNGANNPTAGAELLWAARYSTPMNNASSKINGLMTWMARNYQSNPEEVAKAMSAAAGSTVPILGTAQRDALRNQLTRMRDHAGLAGLREDYTYTELPYTHFWVEANGEFNKLEDGDDYESGYSYNAWGGTLGLEMDITETTSVAAGITALYGTLDGGNADRADGNLDSYYLSLMGRFQGKRWGHTVVGVVGLNEGKLDRTVTYPAGSYTTHGSTNGYSAGLMYEATYDIPLNSERMSMVQPLVNFSLMKTTLKGYDETGQDGQGVGLNVGDQDWVTATIGLGARWIGVVGESGFNRPAQLEVRANIAQDLGDSQGEASVALQANPTLSRTVRAAEVGKTALQLGASLRVPLNEQTLLYFNLDADLRDAMTSWNLGAGVRYDF